MPTGSQRVPKGLQKGTRKWPKMHQKSTGAALGMPKGVRGYPPGASEAPNMHFLCIFMQMLRISMHIYAYFVHIYAYCCTRHPFLCIFIYMCIFRHVYECVYVWYIFVHICVLYGSRSIFHRELNICKYARHKFVSKDYRKHRHTFGR